jgi:hypothetical protein
MQRTLKIIKISEGVFKHVLNDDINNDTVFYNTEETKLTIDLGAIVFDVGPKTRVFRVEEINVYDIAATNPTPTNTLDDLVLVLSDLQYPPLVDLESSASGSLTDEQLTAQALSKEATQVQIKNLLIDISSKLNRLKANIEQFTATAGQTVFTLANIPLGDVAISINGTRIPKNAISVADNTITYISANNLNYDLEAGDIVILDY